VGLVDLDEAGARKQAESLGTRALAVRADAADEGEIGTALHRVVAELGGLDILVNNAGAAGRYDLASGGAGPLVAHSQQGWDATLETNLRTTFAASKAAIPHLASRGGGSIIHIASIAGLMASVGLAAYGAAKAGVIQLTKTMAVELAPAGIRVNAICPGYVWTAAWERLAEMLGQTDPRYRGKTPREVFEAVCRAGVPLGREQTVEDIGRLAAFLASDDARNITGEAIKVDGGITLRVSLP
jgi:NAD(P)-dependent dehydrogenase (short-subunit alcohol dehydrogenase family)